MDGRMEAAPRRAATQRRSNMSEWWWWWWWWPVPCPFPKRVPRLELENSTKTNVVCGQGVGCAGYIFFSRGKIGSKRSQWRLVVPNAFSESISDIKIDRHTHPTPHPPHDSGTKMYRYTLWGKGQPLRLPFSVSVRPHHQHAHKTPYPYANQQQYREHTAGRQAGRPPASPGSGSGIFSPRGRRSASTSAPDGGWGRPPTHPGVPPRPSRGLSRIEDRSGLTDRPQDSSVHQSELSSPPAYVRARRQKQPQTQPNHHNTQIFRRRRPTVCGDTDTVPSRVYTRTTQY